MYLASLPIEWITDFGIPRVLMPDRGRHFIAEVVGQLLEVMRIDRRLSSPYDPTLPISEESKKWLE
jgi:hypothetical protein